MSLAGNLEEFNIVAVLQTLGGEQMTGTLLVRDGAQRVTVSFAEGRIIHAQSTQQQDRLGEILVRTRRLSQANLEGALAYQLRRETGKRLGLILLDAGLIQRDDLVMAVQIQIMEVVSQLLLWGRGQWHFDFGPPDPAGIRPAEAMNLDEILSGQMLVLDAMEPPAAGPETLEAVYAPLPGHSLDPTRISLDRDAWRVLGALDGQRPTAEVAHHAGLEPERTAAIIGDLEAVGLVARLGSAPAASEHDLVVNTPAAAPPPRRVSGRPLVISPAAGEQVNGVLRSLLTRTEAQEACLIDPSGSLITRQGHAVHHDHPTLFALAAGIFASWQELGRTLGESKASTLLYQGNGINVCLTPVGGRAILMTLYRSASDSGLVNFWGREASTRLVRLLDEAAARPATSDTGRLPDAPTLPRNFGDDAARAMDELLRG